MKIISVGNRYEIYEDNIKTSDILPAGTYRVKFNPMSGFSLAKIPDFEIKEKLYGTYIKKVNKLMDAFEDMPRSLGAILSGKKGVGKSLFAQAITVQAREKGIPTIIVDKPYHGVSNFIESIEQEVIVFFDEFEKVFPEFKSDEGESQEEMLGLFDGISTQKRMYLLTINKISGLNEFLLNRPGRFHYHIRFQEPEAEEVEEYLSDKIKEEYKEQIAEVAKFSGRVPLNYDCLRAIAYEINTGLSFAQAIQDLNITRTEHQKYDMIVEFENLPPIMTQNVNLDVFSSKRKVNLHATNGDWVYVTFNPSKGVVMSDGTIVITEDIAPLEAEFDENKEYVDNLRVKSISINLVKTNNLDFKLV